MKDELSQKGNERLVVFYDGDCPFCSNYVELMALRRNAGAVDLVDARSDDPRLADLWRQGLDLNQGMAATYGGSLYYGSDALALISSLSTSNKMLGRMMAHLLRNPRRAKWFYPTMKVGRQIMLKLLGRDMLRPAAD